MADNKDIIGIDLDQAFLTCHSRLYEYLNTINFNSGKNKNICEIKNEIFKIGNINKIFKLFNPNSYIAFPDAIDTIKALQKQNFKIYFISNRPNLKPIIKMTYQWFKINNVDFDLLALGCTNKLEYAKKNDVKYFIDNDMKICKEFASKSEIKAICFDRKERKNSTERDIISTLSWQEIKEYLFSEIIL